MDCIMHGVTKSWTRLSDFTFIFIIPAADFLLAAVCDIKEVLFLVCSYFLSCID